MRVVELFCDAGGMGLGLKRAGFKIVRAYDSWRPALAVHRANLSPPLAALRKETHTWVGDLGDLARAVPAITLLQPDVIAGGPPCVEFSRAKRGRKEGRLADLTTAFGIFVSVARPRYFILENVADALKSAAYRRARILFKHAGYGLTESILDASFHGAATARQRMVIVGCLGEVDGFLTEHLDDKKADRPITVSDVLGADFGHDFGDGRGRLFWFGPGGAGSPGTRRADLPCPTIIRSSLWAPGEAYVPRKGDVANVRDLPVPTPEQFGLLQGFPGEWKWDAAGGKTRIARMIANSVPPPLAKIVGRCVMAHAAGERPAVERAFPDYFDRWLQDQGYGGRRLSDLKDTFRAVQRHLGDAATAPLETALALLDRVPAVANASPQRRSNLRKALRLYDQCVDDLIRQQLPPFDGRSRMTRPVAKDLQDGYWPDVP